MLWGVQEKKSQGFRVFPRGALGPGAWPLAWAGGGLWPEPVVSTALAPVFPGPVLPAPWIVPGNLRGQPACVRFKPHYEHIKNELLLALSLGEEQARPRSRIHLGARSVQ